jgi:hypothetical protein
MPLTLYRIGPDEHHLIEGGEIVGYPAAFA